MEESEVFEYWFAFFVCIGLLRLVSDLCQVKNQGPRHLDVGTGPLHCRFVYRLPLLSISLIRDIIPSCG